MIFCELLVLCSINQGTRVFVVSERSRSSAVCYIPGELRDNSTNDLSKSMPFPKSIRPLSF